ncbi:recombinase family protein [Amycolatopsis rhabdoformis]|uniref:Recombinase family protein n=1 Tax=Amycolatopsis rhabdoformis TaxID=1448059 RepID=A0ABZ1IAC5_9PSEU|nr:recombinase family protein [Amycolatopsis rhabdoformis]WSE30514.1 recombinase family protein [Amycolatopsis rhabdoformis]
MRRSGAKLVSCTENIDDTPSGRLLYGLLAEIAEFYSRNLAQEVMKGLLRKAEEGGTPFRAPLGYLNVRVKINGVEVARVIPDPDRAELVRWCFEQYATGEWNAADLVLEAQAKGLTSKPGHSTPAGEVGLTTMYSMLKNAYYMGIISYQGIHYEGKHEPLVEQEVWLTVQDQLAARTQTGDRDRKHSHYLRSTIYCSDCHGRLVFSQSAGNGGLYSYYHCAKKRTRANNCRRPGMRVERIEQGIADFYRRFELKAEHVQLIQTGVRNEFATQQAEAQAGAARAERRQAQLNDERQKLLQAHYAGHVPGDLLGAEMSRLTRALTEAEVELKAARATTTEVEATLSAALVAAGHCHRAYLTADENVRRQTNQGFFAKLFIGHDGSVEQVELNEPFATLMSPTLVQAMAPHQTATIPPQVAGDETDGLAACTPPPPRPTASSAHSANIVTRITS